jgi:hypothetical protein
LTAAEESFFDQCATGDGEQQQPHQMMKPGFVSTAVPVIAIFTKFDDLQAKAFGKLRDEGLGREDARTHSLKRAKADFEKEVVSRLQNTKYPPAKDVCLSGEKFS